MTSFRVERVGFTAAELEVWADTDPRFKNWPVVYALDGTGDVYVGESHNVVARFRQHLDSDKRALTPAQVVVDETFNKSACLDLESYLIRLFAGDGRYRVLNRNDGITNADYYNRELYQATFDAIFAELRDLGLFSRDIKEIENSDLFKLSPFKALTGDQAIAVEDILEGLFEDLAAGGRSTCVVQGDPGTGKTIIAIYLLKLLGDIRAAGGDDLLDSDSVFAEFFTEGYPELLAGFRVGLVVPQQSLRRSIQSVFQSTPRLHESMVLSPFDVGMSSSRFDLLIVDETHRLNHRANQSSGIKNRQFAEINERLFGADADNYTQLDWITAQSDHQIFLLDAAQSVRPADLPERMTQALVRQAREDQRLYPLTSQLRVAGGTDYVDYVRRLLRGQQELPRTFPGYDLRFFDDLGDMRRELIDREREHRLARLLAGYAWRWNSRKDRTAYDIVIDGVGLRWNSKDVDWVNSPSSVDEVGSIHTIQGYDLNYAGVIIGRDLRFDTARRRLVFDRSQYFDAKGMENNPRLGITYTDDDLLRFVQNIYAVLLTRGMLGTYVHVCDEALREHLRPFFSSA
jgi:DUF2075 family protein